MPCYLGFPLLWSILKFVKYWLKQYYVMQSTVTKIFFPRLSSKSIKIKIETNNTN